MPAASRLARLNALGVEPYRLRGAAGTGPVEAPGDRMGGQAPGGAGATAAQALACVVLLPEACPARDQAQIDRALQALGADFARAPRVQVPAAGLRRPPPLAHAYLAFGEAQARALGQVLSAEQARAVEVVLLDAPGELGRGEAKQRVWQAVKGLRRRLPVR